MASAPTFVYIVTETYYVSPKDEMANKGETMIRFVHFTKEAAIAFARHNVRNPTETLVEGELSTMRHPDTCTEANDTLFDGFTTMGYYFANDPTADWDPYAIRYEVEKHVVKDAQAIKAANKVRFKEG